MIHIKHLAQCLGLKQTKKKSLFFPSSWSQPSVLRVRTKPGYFLSIKQFWGGSGRQKYGVYHLSCHCSVAYILFLHQRYIIEFSKFCKPFLIRGNCHWEKFDNLKKFTHNQESNPYDCASSLTYVISTYGKIDLMGSSNDRITTGDVKAMN